MSYKFYKKIIAVLMALSLISTAAILAYAEGNNDDPVVPASSQTGTGTESSAGTSSVEPPTSSDNTPVVSTSTPESTLVSSEAVSSKKVTSAASSKVASSKKPKTNSSKSKPSSRVYSSAATGGYSAGTVSDDTYNEGSKSGTWEGGNANIEIESSKAVSSSKALSKHITNPKKEILKLIWIPVLIGLICVGVLLYMNLYYYKKKPQKHIPKHSAKAQKRAAFSEDKPQEGKPANSNKQIDDDPFSAENFFHFDDN